ncbi:MAG: PEP-CTERM sorting domain-containing protein [Nostocales cyanobacterium]|nr:MAG: PEP-CTERM sorting domain-containing protein [Nostocales cyanobacterium]
MKSQILTAAALTTIAGIAGIMTTAGTANAASLSYTASSGDFDTTDFTKTLSIQKFNPSLGTLNSVTLDLTGDIKGSARFENRSSRSATVGVNLSSDINLTLGSDTLFNLTPSNLYAYQVARYDGITDYAGASGRTINGLSASTSDTKNLVSNLQPFIGSGNVDFLLSAIAQSNVIGSGNISSQINTLAKGDLTVTYDYSPISTKVPEPSTLLGFGLVAGFGLLSQNKKRQFQDSKS